MHDADQVGFALHLHADWSRLQHAQCCRANITAIINGDTTSIHQRQAHGAAAAFDKVGYGLRIAARTGGQGQLRKHGNLPRERNAALDQASFDVLRVAREQQRAYTEHRQ